MAESVVERLRWEIDHWPDRNPAKLMSVGELKDILAALEAARELDRVAFPPRGLQSVETKNNLFLLLHEALDRVFEEGE